MKRLLNTLFITTEGLFLAKEGETVTVKQGPETRLRVPIHTLGGIVCFGHVACSPELMHFCSERGVSISMVSVTGRFLARVEGFHSGNVLLRREQYRQADDMVKSSAITRSFLLGKVMNSRQVLLRALRDHPNTTDSVSIENTISTLKRILRNIRGDYQIDELRGFEGEAASRYFSVFNHLIRAQKSDFKFTFRSRRPPLDNVNCMLSFGYTLLLHDIRSALAAVGLDTDVGYLHRDRPGRPGLALDMMEEFRAFIVDRLVLSLINRNQVKGEGFIQESNGEIRMNDETRKTFITTYQKRKQDEIIHPFLGKKAPVGMLFYLQALLMGRYLRGELDGYPPFFWK